MTRMTWPLSTDEEQGPKQTRQAIPGEDILEEEEIINLDPDSKEEETQATEITQIGMTNSAISARFKGTDKKNAGNKSRRINPVVMPKDRLTGRGSTSWRNIQKRSQSTPLTTMTPYTRTMKTHSTFPEFSISQEPQPFPAILGFSVKSWMTPLIQAPSVIPQLI
jgi:hypothetical protein